MSSFKRHEKPTTVVLIYMASKSPIIGTIYFVQKLKENEEEETHSWISLHQETSIKSTHFQNKDSRSQEKVKQELFHSVKEKTFWYIL